MSSLLEKKELQTVAARAAIPYNPFYLTRVGSETAHTVRGRPTRPFEYGQHV